MSALDFVPGDGHERTSVTGARRRFHVPPHLSATCRLMVPLMVFIPLSILTTAVRCYFQRLVSTALCRIYPFDPQRELSSTFLNYASCFVFLCCCVFSWLVLALMGCLSCLSCLVAVVPGSDITLWHGMASLIAVHVCMCHGGSIV